MQVVPDLAGSWEISSDGTSYTFHIKRGAIFSNKREVIADDFKYSFKRILMPQTRSPNAWVLDKIQGAEDFKNGRASDVSGIKIEDKYTIKIILKEPFTPFLGLLCMTAASVVSSDDIKKWGNDFSTHPAGTGPFVLREWRHNQYLRLEARDDYFDGVPNTKGLVYKIIPEDLTAVAEFETGGIDVLSIPAAMFRRYTERPEWKDLVSSAPGINTYYLPVLRNWPTPEIYGYDPEKARDLINEAGYPQGLKIKIYLTVDQEVLDMLEVIQDYLQNVGIKTELRQLEWSAYKEAINSGEPDAFWISWWADYPDPENFLFPLFHSSNFGAGGNRTRYKNEAVDMLIEQGQGSVSKTSRDEYYRNAEQLIVRDAPWVFFWHRTEYTVRQPRVKNYRIYPLYIIDKGMDVGL
ncbi:MAG: ABC transporter substrate-binding protein [Nitrospirae bacterium]|nr:ABC transporter substrate-binding protein [Nitrospirota bacterium]